MCAEISCLSEARTKSPISNERVEAYRKAFELREQGLGPRRIAKIIGVPWPTIGHWFYSGYHPLGATNRFEPKASLELAYLIGAVLGDGCLNYSRSRQNYNIVCMVKDREFAEEISKTLAKVLGRKQPYKIQQPYRNRNLYPYYRVEAGSYELFQFLKKPLNELRPWIEAYPTAFLRGIYDAEGSIYANDRGYFVITLSNTNKDIIMLAKTLLENLGFHPTLRSNLKHFGEYKLSLYHQAEVERFLKEIGFTIKRKQEKMEVD